MTNPITLITDNKQLVTTAAVAVAAFLAALPVGASVMPQQSNAKTDSVVKTVTRTASAAVGSCVADESDVASASTAVKSASTATHSHTNTHTNTQTSTGNSGSTAQVGRDGVAAAVTVGDVLSNNNVPVLSHNNVSVPVLSNNATTVSPSVSLLSNNSNGGLVGLGVLGL